MKNRLVVINIVGLTPSLLGEYTPYLNTLINDGFMTAMEGVFPAVTCTAQASMLTGTQASEHGIVANGWYFRDLAEVWFWRQSNRLVKGEKVWHALQKIDPDFRCAKLFWWYNMYADVDFSVTPRPIYPADGRKIPGIYSKPTQLSSQLEQKLGAFPMFNFWGPAADICSSQWIADSAKFVFDQQQPNLLFVYLPHLDYNLQRLGPKDPYIWKDVKAIDSVAGQLIEHVRAQGADVTIVSEYGIEQAKGYVHINRILREHDKIAVRETLGWELLDFGASEAFAVADHQVAHIYIKDASQYSNIKRIMDSTPGIERVLGEEEKKAWGLDHPRSGELIAIAEPGYWFTYYYWQDDDKAPDFARTVDIHRKPGYDPAELFIDPDISCPKLKIARKLMQKNLGFRMLMDVVPLKPELVNGTHGRLVSNNEHSPIYISTYKQQIEEPLKMTDIKQCLISALMRSHD